MPEFVQEAKEIKSLIITKSEAKVLGKMQFDEEEESSEDNINISNVSKGIYKYAGKDEKYAGKDDSIASETGSNNMVRKLGKRGKSEMSEVMQFMLVNEMTSRRNDAKREREEQKREKRERKKDRKDDKRHQQTMMMMMMMISGNKKMAKKMKVNDDSSESLSSSASSSNEVEVVQEFENR
jgi:hypothetical protein